MAGMDPTKLAEEQRVEARRQLFRVRGLPEGDNEVMGQSDGGLFQPNTPLRRYFNSI